MLYSERRKMQNCKWDAVYMQWYGTESGRGFNGETVVLTKPTCDIPQTPRWNMERRRIYREQRFVHARKVPGARPPRIVAPRRALKRRVQNPRARRPTVQPDDTYTADELATAKAYIESIIKNENPLDIIPRLICPTIIGNEDAKAALTCMLASQFDAPASRQRVHLLFHGIAGTAKTGLIDWLVDSWNALYISMEASNATLKGDARRKDDGVKLLNAYDLGIVCMDDFELFPKKDTLRDVMEKGYYTQAKGGRYRNLPARVRLLAACNDTSGLSDAIKSRFDITCYFDVPDIEESVEIAKAMAANRENAGATDEIIRVYMALANEHIPTFDDPERLGSVFERHFKREGAGKTGRWIGSVYRISSAIARLRFGDVTEQEVKWALEIKRKSDNALEEMEG